MPAGEPEAAARCGKDLINLLELATVCHACSSPRFWAFQTFRGALRFLDPAGAGVARSTRAACASRRWALRGAKQRQPVVVGPWPEIGKAVDRHRDPQGAGRIDSAAARPLHLPLLDTAACGRAKTGMPRANRCDEDLWLLETASSPRQGGAVRHLPLMVLPVFPGSMRPSRHAVGRSSQRCLGIPTPLCSWQFVDDPARRSPPDEQAGSQADWRLWSCPGGFSYGDYLRLCGCSSRLPLPASHGPLASGKCGLCRQGWAGAGIGQRLQVLTELGLLTRPRPWALANRRLHFLCEPATAHVQTRTLPWLA